MPFFGFNTRNFRKYRFRNAPRPRKYFNPELTAMVQTPFPTRLTSYRFGILLSVFLLQLLTAPFFEGSMNEGYVADILFYLLLAAAAFSVRESRFFKLAISLGAGAILGESASYLSDETYILVVTNFISCAYLALVTLIIAANVSRQREISADTVLGGLCVYVLIGIFWTVVFVNLELLRPGSFSFSVHGTHPNMMNTFCLIMYYSFVTLLTIGYGDVVPLSRMAQTLTIVEGLIGQFYLIFFMASLVGLYIQKRLNRRILP